jgi:hypothetical protein
MNEHELLNKLAISKKIMDTHKSMPRNQSAGNFTNDYEEPNLDVPKPTYNIPQEYMMESKPVTKLTNEVPTKERILQSKLPDEIKRLMIEHPIHQQSPMNQQSSVLSNELVEKAARLMKNDVANNVSPYQDKKPKIQELNYQDTTPNLDKNLLKDMIKETIQEVLSENGLLVESSSKTNDVFQFRVGSHIFEGKVTKIKKVR